MSKNVLGNRRRLSQKVFSTQITLILQMNADFIDL